MRLHWLTIGFLTVSAIFAQPPAPQGPPPQGGAAQDDGAGAPADEPGRAVARLSVLTGDASIRRGDSSEWVAAAVNSPLMSGDQISVAAGGHAEVQLDAAHYLRIGGDTELRLADLENSHYQVQVAHGLVTWRVLRESQAQAEISTPLVGVHPGRQSVVRVEVSPDGTSHVTVRRGDADVSTEKGTEKLAENKTMDVRGSAGDPEFQVVAAAARDEFDGWNDQRDTYLLRAQSPRYVPPAVSGTEDLDAYGRWSYDPNYGSVWTPAVDPGWAPYQNGQWVWEDYYGWTWVDYSPWGWAPFHYGSWYNRVGFGWTWYPGPRFGRVWWRPAMVGFIGWGGGGIGLGFGFGFGNIGWVALAPHEIFRPWYGRGGFGAFRGGGVVHANVAGTFRNAGVARGVTAVSAADFQRGNFRNTVAVDRGTLQQASLVRGTVPVTPTAQNLRFSNRAATVAPNSNVASQRFFGSGASSAAARRTPFTQQQAAVRSAVGGQAQVSASQGRMQSQPQAAVQGRAQVQSQTAAGWSRFQGTPSSNGAVSSARPAAPAGNAARGFNRFNSTPGGSANSQQRPVQVSPSIIRQRPEAAPAPQQYRSEPQARPQQAPAPAPAPRGNYYGGGSAPRSAPAGGNRGSQRGGRR